MDQAINSSGALEILGEFPAQLARAAITSTTTLPLICADDEEVQAKTRSQRVGPASSDFPAASEFPFPGDDENAETAVSIAGENRNRFAWFGTASIERCPKDGNLVQQTDRSDAGANFEIRASSEVRRTLLGLLIPG